MLPANELLGLPIGADVLFGQRHGRFKPSAMRPYSVGSSVALQRETCVDVSWAQPGSSCCHQCSSSGYMRVPTMTAMRWRNLQGLSEVPDMSGEKRKRALQGGRLYSEQGSRQNEKKKPKARDGLDSNEQQPRG